MKRTLLLATLCLILSNAWSQTEEKSIIKFNPLSALIGSGSIFYEQKIDDKHSWQLGAAYMGLKIDNVRITGFSLTPEYRIYPRKNALSGFYFGPYLRYQSLTLKVDSDKGTLSTFGGGVLLGRQWVYKSGFVFDMFAGPSLSSGKIDSSSGNVTDPGIGLTGFGIRIGAAIGFSF
jgi:hypothetical protein